MTTPPPHDFDSIIGTAPAPDDRAAGRPRAGTKKSKKRWLIPLIIVLIIVLILAGGATWYLVSLGRKFDDNANKLSQEQVFGKDTTADSTGTNVLMMGSDSRQKGVDYDKSTGVRSDTLMVAHIPEKKGKGVQVVSIPRDSFVKIPRHGKAKINASLSWGGIPLTIKTVQDYLKIKIDHVAIIDFDGFKELTDALGGVDVNAQVAFSAHGHRYRKGLNHVNGEEALWFVRERHAFADGDMQRQRDQQEYLRAVMRKVLSKDTMTSPRKVSTVVTEFSPFLTVDDGLSSSKLVKLGLGIGAITSSDVKFTTAPISGDGREAGGQLVLYPDQKRLKKLQKAFANDTLGDYADRAGDEHYK